MTQQNITAKIFRFDPDKDSEPYYKTYPVPYKEGLSAMDVLDYIYQNLDSSLAYYDHAGCSLGICGKCTARINAKPGLLCQTPVSLGDLTIEPVNKKKVLKDLVIRKKGPSEESDEIRADHPEQNQDINSVDLIVRREIEALIAAPLIRAYMDAFGEEAAHAVAGKVIANLAEESGKMLNILAGGDTMAHLQRALPMFSQGGALEFNIEEATERKAAVNVTRCKYAEMYKKHNLEKFGFLLGCGRDFALMKGFNPQIKFSRTRTIMEGADHCDFRFEMEK